MNKDNDKREKRERRFEVLLCYEVLASSNIKISINW